MAGSHQDSTASPDRKRSLDDDTNSDSGTPNERTSRFKRQATAEAGADSISLVIDDDEEAHGAGGAGGDDARQASSRSRSNHAGASAEQQPYLYGATQDQYGQQHHDGGVDPMTGEPRENKSVRMRALISPKEAGIIIGKGGQHVAEVRENSGARVTVSGQMPGALDRVVTITGTVEADARAFYLISTKLAASSPDAPLAVDPSSRSVTLRLLVPQMRIGVIIGKQGVRIKELQESSGCRIMAQGEPLPNSTERVVTLSGQPHSLQTAVARIGHLVGDVSDKTPGLILYVPQPTMAYSMPHMGMAFAQGMQPMAHPGFAAAAAAAAAQQRSMGYSAMANYNAAAVAAAAGSGSNGASTSGNMSAANGAQQQAAAAAAYYGMPGMTAHQAAAVAQMGAYGFQGYGAGMMPQMAAGYMTDGRGDGSLKTEQITIPEDCVGAIIGKGGSKINEIRASSGCQIKIGDSQPGLRRRIITLTGTPDAVARAQYALLERVNQEGKKQERR
ncbi:PAB1 binding protein [Polyrhizophydium stewartii]|uniref:PAB1 binding protein n=1 Tax=Polyrhizophydium stewartii TaxID=2732419 RepID=A0ABR4N8S0_9FUNG|nr:RNA binding protein, heterogenous nuclear RNP-K like protein [Polyrhizophydium stewartii]